MADEDKGGEAAEKEQKLAVGKDLKEKHSSYSEAMRRRQAIHDALIEADYRRGYVSMDESPGEDNKPLITHRISYNTVDRKGRCELVQTFRDFKGSGDTALIHEKSEKGNNKLTGASPTY